MSDDDSGRSAEPHAPAPSSPNGPDPLERARIRAVYAVLIIIVASSAGTISGYTPHIDLGWFATLMGGLISLLGLGAVIRLVGRG